MGEGKGTRSALCAWGGRTTATFPRGLGIPCAAEDVRIRSAVIGKSPASLSILFASICNCPHALDPEDQLSPGRCTFHTQRNETKIIIRYGPVVRDLTEQFETNAAISGRKTDG